ncbi:hypothetical protein B5X24_HaOG200899 [Helicoverpa armigera]|nr:hypothetical protein B5X24_HaOG200899 [Helicoverpa armigera]
MELVKLEMFIKAIMIFRIVCGLYCKITSNKIIAAIIKIYCALVIVIVFVISLSYLRALKNSASSAFAFGMPASKYFVNSVVHFCFDGDNFYEFFHSLKNLQITQDSELKYDIPITIFLFISITGARLKNYSRYYWLGMSDGHFRFDRFMSFCFGVLISYIGSITCVMRFMMFELLWRRMAMLRKRLEQDLLNARRFENEEGVLRKQLRACLSIYKGILDSTRKNDAPMKLLVTHLYIIFLNNVFQY